MGSCLGHLFYAIDQCVSFYASTILFLFYSSVTQLEIYNSNASSSSFIIQDSFSYLVVFFFPFCVSFYMKPKIALSISMKNYARILMGTDCLEYVAVQIAFG